MLLLLKRSGMTQVVSVPARLAHSLWSGSLRRTNLMR